MTPTQFLERRMALSGLFRFRETSGYRSPFFNEKVGGVDDSLHQLWLAVDLILEDMSLRNIERFIRVAWRLELLAIHENVSADDEHIHLQIPHN